jgi:hypothetical protein
MSSAFNINGKVVNVNDRVTILGTVVTIGGSLNTSTITVQPPLSTSTFACQAGDLGVTEGVFATGTSGYSYGNAFNVGDSVSVKGYVTAITGSGNTAQLTITLASSGASITGIPSGACQSDGF